MEDNRMTKMSDIIKALEAYIKQYGDVGVKLHIKMDKGIPILEITDRQCCSNTECRPAW